VADHPLVAITDHALERYAQRVPGRTGALDRRPELAGRVARAWAAGRRTPGPRGAVHVRDLERPGLVFVARHDRPRGELVVITVWEEGEDAEVPRAFTDALEVRPGEAPVDVAVIGAGIVGCAVAAHLAEAGLQVRVLEREAVAAGASGRNSGVVQHPLDAALVALHRETLAVYRELGLIGAEPAGVLVLAEDPAALAGVGAGFPELAPERLAGAALRAQEPALAPDLAAVRLDTGHPVRPAAATEALAARARAAGARFALGRPARLVVERGRVAGVALGTRRLPAERVVLAAGPWTPGLADPTGRWRPIAPVWGATAAVALPEPPRHVLEEAGVEAIMAAGEGVPAIFSLVTAEGRSVLGSTFTREAPDPAALAPELLARGARFVPALARAEVLATRACARPQAADGRPLLGPLPGVEGLFVAAGHGPWGVSLGPASGRVVADLLLTEGRAGPVAPELAAGRFGGVGEALGLAG